MTTPATDSYVQVAADGPGKQVDMIATTTAAGQTIYRQRTEVVGMTLDTLVEINSKQDLILANLRALVFMLGDGTVDENNFLGQ